MEGTKTRAAYGGSAVISERHRHRYEVNSRYIGDLAKAGLVVSGTSVRGGLVETIELPNHPWFVACQYHPEFQSTPLKPHPLFLGFMEAISK